MSYAYTTQRQVRKAFWEAHEGVPTVTKRKITAYNGREKMYDTDTRCAFVYFVDALCGDGRISAELARRVTL